MPYFAPPPEPPEPEPPEPEPPDPEPPEPEPEPPESPDEPELLEPLVTLAHSSCFHWASVGFRVAQAVLLSADFPDFVVVGFEVESDMLPDDLSLVATWDDIDVLEVLSFALSFFIDLSVVLLAVPLSPPLPVAPNVVPAEPVLLGPADCEDGVPEEDVLPEVDRSLDVEPEPLMPVEPDVPLVPLP